MLVTISVTKKTTLNRRKPVSSCSECDGKHASILELVMVKHSVSSTRHHEQTDKDQRDDGIIMDSLDLSSLPLPWYRSHSLWTNLMARTFDETYKCHSNFLEAHPAISTRMRSVLCDWLIEVRQRERWTNLHCCLGVRSVSSSSRELSSGHRLRRSVFVQYHSVTEDETATLGHHFSVHCCEDRSKFPEGSSPETILVFTRKSIHPGSLNSPMSPTKPITKEIFSKWNST